MGLKDLVRKGIRSAGFDIIRYPVPDWLPLREHLLAVFAALRINCVLDVGAHWGEYAYFLRQIGYRGQIISFEPVTSSYERLQRRCANDPAWSAVRMALGDREAMVSINLTEHTDFSSLLNPNEFCSAEFGNHSKVVGTEVVPMKRLEEIFCECTSAISAPRVYLKIDTQGYDLAVLKGAQECLSRILAVQTELSVKPIYLGQTGYAHTIETMNQVGFGITGLFPVTRDAGMEVIEFDCVMVRRTPSPVATQRAVISIP